MAIPDYQEIMLPILKLAEDNEEHSLREAIESLAPVFSLTDSEKKELLPSGQQSIFDNRVGWAKTYLKKAGLLKSTRRGYFKITDRGLKVLSDRPEQIDVQYLTRFEEFVAFISIRKVKTDNISISNDDQTPEEQLENSYQKVRTDLAIELLDTVKSCSPTFFEKLVVDLLVKMGYGGTRRDAGQAIGKTGDEGIDGIIKEDRFGLDIIYIQAKRWESSIGRPEVQKFAGALQGQRAKKGIFITTSSFSNEAHEYVKKLDSKIVLIDGDSLAQFMIDYNVGVSPVSVYEIKRIDSDYFIED